MTSSVRSLFLRYTAFQLCFGMLIWLPVFYEVQRRAGLGDAAIFSIQSMYSVAFLLLELPTGIAADRLGFRASLAIGAGFLVLANLWPVADPSYRGFLVHFLWIAAARSFVSGASSAYLFESLRADREAYAQIEGKARAVSLGAKVVVWSSVGVLMRIHPWAPYWGSAAFAVLALGFALRLPAEVRPQAVVRESVSLREVWSRSTGHRGTLVLVMLQGVALFVLGRLIQVNLFQPILLGQRVNLEFHGTVMALMTFSEAVGSWNPAWLPRRLGGNSDRVRAVSGATLIALFCVALIGFCSGAAATPLVIAALVVFSWAIGLAFPLQRQLMNERIPVPEFRATFLSAESIVDRAANAGATALLSFAFLGSSSEDPRSLQRVLLGMAIACLVLTLGAHALLRWRENRAQPKTEEALA